MPRPRAAVPAYCHHKPSNQAFVRVRTADDTRKIIYLGAYGTDASRQEYERVLATLRTSPVLSSSKLPAAPGALSVNEALLLYSKHVSSYYPPTSARGHFEALRAVRLIAGDLLLREFTPKVFKIVRQTFIDAKQSRTTVNSRAGRIKLFIKWCVAEELADPNLLGALKAVTGLRKGRGEAKELPAVRPPSDEELEKMIAAASPNTAALMRIQSLCGARAGELVKLRGDDIDRTGDVWKATVVDHKGRWQGKTRTLYFGPRCKEVLAPLILKAAGGFLFPKATGKPFRTPGYRQAVQRCCRRAGITKFSTHALRHYAATRIRRMLDVETARALLGHSDMGLTAEVYAEFDEKKASDAMNLVG